MSARRVRCGACGVGWVRCDDASHLTFGWGVRHCLGAALARLEGRVALDEFLNRFPVWDVDHDAIELAPTSTLRGWQRMPILLP
jgi:cytochrome P450